MAGRQADPRWLDRGVPAGVQVRNYHGTQTDPAAVTDRDAACDNCSRPDPYLTADKNVAVDDRTVANERSRTNLDVVGHEGVVADASLPANTGRVMKQSERDGSVRKDLDVFLDR